MKKTIMRSVLAAVLLGVTFNLWQNDQHRWGQNLFRCDTWSRSFLGESRATEQNGMLTELI